MQGYGLTLAESMPKLGLVYHAKLYMNKQLTNHHMTRAYRSLVHDLLNKVTVPTSLSRVT